MMARSLSPTDKLVALAILKFANRKTFIEWHSVQAWPSIGTLATLLNLGEATVKRSLRRLRELGVVAVERKEGRDHRHNRYRLRLEWRELEERGLNAKALLAKWPDYRQARKPRAAPNRLFQGSGSNSTETRVIHDGDRGQTRPNYGSPLTPDPTDDLTDDPTDRPWPGGVGETASSERGHSRRSGRASDALASKLARLRQQ